MQLTAEADTLEAKRRITDSLNTVIERAESRVRFVPPALDSLRLIEGSRRSYPSWAWSRSQYLNYVISAQLFVGVETCSDGAL